jgi:phytoene dehydrogenase-like protein
MSKVIIIGSGIGGLTAGNLLAKKGHNVTIFESHSEPGGYTAGFWRKGFYFESGTLSFESSGSIFKAMKDIGVYDKIGFVRQKSRWVSADFDGLLENYADFKKLILSAYPDEKERLNKYFAEVDRMYNAMPADQPMADLYDGLSYTIKLASSMLSGMKFIGIYKKYNNVTIDEFTAQYFEKDSKLYMLLKGLGYPEMSAWLLGGAVSSFLEDYWTVKSGMQSWADVLVDNFKSLGGELRLKSYVDKIITKNGTAVGVSCDGNIYDADYVISAGDYKKTFLKLLDDQSLVPKDTLEGIKSAEVSEGIFTVYLGLNISNEKLMEYMKIPHVMYFDEKPGADVGNPNDAEYFQKVSFNLYSNSLFDSKLSPEGKSSLMIQAVSPRKWMNNWGGGDAGKYKELKENAQNALIQKAAFIIPNLSNIIEYADSATPLTYEKFTHNTDGATSAWSWNPKKRFYKNPISSATNTPVKNLLIGSCWASQIGGVPGAIAAAYKCAKSIE